MIRDERNGTLPWSWMNSWRMEWDWDRNNTSSLSLTSRITPLFTLHSPFFLTFLGRNVAPCNTPALISALTLSIAICILTVLSIDLASSVLNARYEASSLSRRRRRPEERREMKRERGGRTFSPLVSLHYIPQSNLFCCTNSSNQSRWNIRLTS